MTGAQAAGEGRGALTIWDRLALALMCLVLFLPGFATLPPTDRDEGRYIVTSQRMADTGDLVDLRYQDQPRYLQPAGIYWLQSTAARVFDGPAHDSVWAYRIPSLLGAVLAVLLTAGMGARYFGRTAGLTAAALLAASFSLGFEARIAKIDASLLAAIMAAQAALMRAYVEPAAGRWTAAAFWAALGVGVMLKGPVILIFTGGTIAALTVWDRLSGRGAAWLKTLRPAWGPLLTIAIAAPWLIAIGVITDGAFYTRALMQNFLGKVGEGEQGHAGPFGYHLAIVLVAFWPGSLFLLRAAGHAWRERGSAAVRFLICWIAPAWIVFEFVATKLPHYVLPTYPAIACLAAASLAMLGQEAARPDKSLTGWVKRVGEGLFAAVWLGASAAVAGLGAGLRFYQEGVVDSLAAGLGAASFAAAAAALWLLARKRAAACVIAVTLAAAFAWGGAYGAALPGLNSLWLSPRIAEAAQAASPCPGPAALVTIPYSEPSLVFLHGRTRTEIAYTPEGAAEAFAAAGPCALALIGAQEQAAFAAEAARLGLALQPAGEIAGLNYSNGDDLRLTFFQAATAGEGGPDPR